MIAVIFEVWPAQMQDYLNIAAGLRSELALQDGFISIERFSSLSEPSKLLSLSFWRDEAAVKAWRCGAQHRAAQSLGRKDVFADYRLRVAAVTRDYGLNERDQVPEDSLIMHG
ncbi:antibiotic biosynthesis monooxygenase family protein [Iodobacter fluviatilis]|uniref:Antibiotic biosynthesis monooxygenase n=1 Tax=Iodobacter fluviatilis TaxID=537 RepID=A0A377SVX7_9NEIS|nr:antibiotic biosynthesis monooxygenase [Iodobacter fluviatilis]TCU82238.1 heme-degrading monooxygenase HmoA [Iodobacter fluviatilis]STR45133.1 Antibiotic biosynthesis monooxygenase [Iodobacter fluviatilis]